MRVAALSVAMFLTTCAMPGQAPTSTPEGHVPGSITTLRTALPELQRLHPGGYVWSMISYTTDLLPAGGDWTLQVMAETPGENHGYELDRKGILTPGIPAAVGQRHYPPIAALDGQPLPAYVESWDAVARADRAAGREFRARTLGYIYSLGLSAIETGEPTWEVLFTAGTTRLRVNVNALDGSITSRP